MTYWTVNGTEIKSYVILTQTSYKECYEQLVSL